MERHSGGHARCYKSYLASASTTAGSVAEGAASRKDSKYYVIALSHVFVLLAIETPGLTNFKELKFLSELSVRLTAIDDNREPSFMFQQITILIERSTLFSSKLR